MALALVSAMMFTACDPDSKTPEGDKTKLWPAGVNGESLLGYIDASGQMVIKANYKSAYGFSCGWAVVRDEDGEVLYIDKNGQKARGAEADTYSQFYYDRARFGEKGSSKTLYGMWDTNFAVVIPADYEYLSFCSNDGLITFSEDGKSYGFMDKNGKVVIPEEFDDADGFDDGICIVVEEGSEAYKYGVIDTKGNELIEMQKKSIYNLGEGRLSFYNSDKDKFGMWDSRGEEIIGATYDAIYSFSCGLALVEKNGKCGFIDKNGNEIISLSYAGASSFADDVAWVQKNSDSKIELIDKSGNQVLKLKDSESPNGNFHNGLCEIRNDEGVHYYIDKNGEKIYKWDPNAKDDDDEAPARKFFSKKANIERMKATEYGARFESYEKAMERMAR